MARESPHTGSTKLDSNDKIAILYDAELKGVDCSDKICLCCRCSSRDNDRSYLYVRENSIETNEAVICICCSSWFSETTRVLYYDRAPFKPAPICCCCPCCGYSEPKLEVLQSGCWCCTKRTVCCEQVVVVPYEKFLCCSNRTAKAGLCNCWLCCWGVLGPSGLDGVPKAFIPFSPQPKDPWAFVAAFAKSSGLAVSLPPGQEDMKAKE